MRLGYYYSFQFQLSDINCIIVLRFRESMSKYLLYMLAERVRSILILFFRFFTTNLEEIFLFSLKICYLIL